MLAGLVDVAPRWQYLAILAICLLATAPLELFFGARVYARWRKAALAIVIGAAPFVLWDYLAIRAGNWEYSPVHTIGLMIGVFPLEELLFFVVIPICALLTYEAVGNILDGKVRLGKVSLGKGRARAADTDPSPDNENDTPADDHEGRGR